MLALRTMPNADCEITHTSGRKLLCYFSNCPHITEECDLGAFICITAKDRQIDDHLIILITEIHSVTQFSGYVVGTFKVDGSVKLYTNPAFHERINIYQNERVTTFWKEHLMKAFLDS